MQDIKLIYKNLWCFYTPTLNYQKQKWRNHLLYYSSPRKIIYAVYCMSNHNKAVLKNPVARNDLCLLLWLHVIPLSHSTFYLLCSFEYFKPVLATGLLHVLFVHDEELFHQIFKWLHHLRIKITSSEQPSLTIKSAPVTFYPTISFFFHSTYNFLILYYSFTFLFCFFPSN